MKSLGHNAAELISTDPPASAVIDLLREADHRTANSLQLAKSFLELHARRSASAEVKAELRAAATLIHSLGLVHQTLSRLNGDEMLDLCAYMDDLIAEIQRCHEGPDALQVALRIDCARPIPVPPNVASKLGIVVAEMATNCAKYAGPRAVCTFAVWQGEGELRLTIRDTGPGMPDAGTEGIKTGLGTRIIQAQISDLGGTITRFAASVGVHFEIRLPLRGS